MSNNPFVVQFVLKRGLTHGASFDTSAYPLLSTIFIAPISNSSSRHKQATRTFELHNPVRPMQPCEVHLRFFETEWKDQEN